MLVPSHGEEAKLCLELSPTDRGRRLSGLKKTKAGYNVPAAKARYRVRKPVIQHVIQTSKDIGFSLMRENAADSTASTAHRYRFYYIPNSHSLEFWNASDAAVEFEPADGDDYQQPLVCGPQSALELRLGTYKFRAEGLEIFLQNVPLSATILDNETNPQQDPIDTLSTDLPAGEWVVKLDVGNVIQLPSNFRDSEYSIVKELEWHDEGDNYTFVGRRDPGNDLIMIEIVRWTGVASALRWQQAVRIHKDLKHVSDSILADLC